MADPVARPTPPVPGPAPIDSSLPPSGARILAMIAIVIAGICGGLIGYKVTRLSIHGGGSVAPGIGGLVGAVIFAGGVAIVAVLVLRAMAEWNTIVESGDPAAARRNRRPS